MVTASQMVEGKRYVLAPNQLNLKGEFYKKEGCVYYISTFNGCTQFCQPLEVFKFVEVEDAKTS